MWSPSLAALWAEWAPPAERSRIDSFPQVRRPLVLLLLLLLLVLNTEPPFR